MFDTLLVANRAEIACRTIRSAHTLGPRTVAVYSDPDRTAPHLRMADEAVRLGPAPATDSYLRADLVLEAALAIGAGAVHPGYGFSGTLDRAGRVVTERGTLLGLPWGFRRISTHERETPERSFVLVKAPCPQSAAVHRAGSSLPRHLSGIPLRGICHRAPSDQ